MKLCWIWSIFSILECIQESSTLEGIQELRINILLNILSLQQDLTFVEQKSPIVPLYYILFFSLKVSP